jgi:hypothetical protein
VQHWSESTMNAGAMSLLTTIFQHVNWALPAIA